MDKSKRAELIEAIYRWEDSPNLGPYMLGLEDEVLPLVDSLLAEAWDAGWNVASAFNFPEDMDRAKYNPYRQDTR